MERRNCRMNGKRITAFLLSVLMMAAMLPSFSMSVFAEENGARAISIGAGNIKKGSRVNIGADENYEDPISWLVLGEANSTDLKKYNEYDEEEVVSPANARLLITEETYDVTYFGNWDYNGWQGSAAQERCKGFVGSFSDPEREAILVTSKTDGSFSDWGGSTLEDEQLFLLSAEEVSDGCGYFNGDESRIAYDKLSGDMIEWWLRSPYRENDEIAALVWSNGSVTRYPVLSPGGFRPAFNLNLESVLFTSAATGGKSSGAAGADALQKVSSYSGKDWKLTIKDSARSAFEASYDSSSGDLITIKYSGALAGPREYISAIIVNGSGEITYYGNLASAAAGDDNTVSVNLAGKYNDGDKLYVFNEKCNGGGMTDYASGLQEIDGSKPKLTITAKDKTYLYTGELQGPYDDTYEIPADIAEMVQVDGLKEGDAISSVTVGGLGMYVGEYTNALIPYGARVNGVPAAEKYNVTYVKGTIRIEPNVNISPGRHMTIVGNPDKLSQGVKKDYDMRSVYLTADDGYYFPKDYSEDSVNGIEVTRETVKKITVSGRLTGDKADIILADASPVPDAMFTVSFDGNGGSGTMTDATGIFGEYTLPGCLFTAPGNKAFDCWIVDEEEYDEGSSIIVEADTIVAARWKEPLLDKPISEDTTHAWDYVKAEEQPTEEQPTEEQPTEEQPTEEQPTEEQPEEKPAKIPPLLAKAVVTGEKTVKITWNRIAQADRYVIYMAECNSRSRCIVTKLQKAKTIKNNEVTSWTKKKLVKGQFYKFRVEALKKTEEGKYRKLKTSLTGHFVAGNESRKYTNPKSLKLNMTKVTLEKGDSSEITGRITMVNKNKKMLPHAATLRFISSDKKVARVSSSGKITAVNAGTCKIYVQTVNGLWKTVKVRVRQSS